MEILYGKLVTEMPITVTLLCLIVGGESHCKFEEKLQVLVLPSRGLMHPAPDDDFVIC